MEHLFQDDDVYVFLICANLHGLWSPQTYYGIISRFVMYFTLSVHGEHSLLLIQVLLVSCNNVPDSYIRFYFLLPICFLPDKLKTDWQINCRGWIWNRKQRDSDCVWKYLLIVWIRLFCTEFVCIAPDNSENIVCSILRVTVYLRMMHF